MESKYIFRKILSWAFTLLIIGGAIWVYFNFRGLLDYFAYKTTPPGSVAETYSSDLNLTHEATLILYGTYPKLDDKQEFNADCKPPTNVVELGCYKTGINKIYVLTVNEPNLKTIMNTTMAHEMLHSAYTRISKTEKDRINSLLEDQVKKIQNKDLTERLASYDKTEPGSRSDELYSILGTEFPNLSTDLENHYKKFFNNRAAIASQHIADEKYLSSQEEKIISEKKAIENDKTTLDSLNTRMTSLKSSNQIDQYNALVSRQNNLVDKLKKEIDIYNNNVATYNDIINSINSRSYSSFDSNQIK